MCEKYVFAGIKRKSILFSIKSLILLIALTAILVLLTAITVSATVYSPWTREAVDATSLLLKSPMGKIAANIKFENVWTKTFLGHWVKNWVHDTMLGAHVLNNSPKVSNLTFQAFVYLGMPRYDQFTKSYLKSGSTNKLNRIKDLDLKDLLLYNGLDVLLEYNLAMIQMKLLGEQL